MSICIKPPAYPVLPSSGGVGGSSAAAVCYLPPKAQPPASLGVSAFKGPSGCRSELRTKRCTTTTTTTATAIPHTAASGDCLHATPNPEALQRKPCGANETPSSSCRLGDGCWPTAAALSLMFPALVLACVINRELLLLPAASARWLSYRFFLL